MVLHFADVLTLLPRVLPVISDARTRVLVFPFVLFFQAQSSIPDNHRRPTDEWLIKDRKDRLIFLE